MASMKRNKTKYPGVTFIINCNGERVYYIRYRKDNKAIEEKVGKKYPDDMTPAKASGIRTDRMQGKALSNSEKRQEKAQRAAEWTVGSLWNEYSQLLKDGNTDICNWKNHLKKTFSKKKPKDLIKLDTDRVRISPPEKKVPTDHKACTGIA
jgi:hypothetical protein